MKIFIIGWFDEFLETIKIAALEFLARGFIVETCGNFNHIEFNEFCMNKITVFNPDFILVWNIYQDECFIKQLSKKYKLLMFNWDDPHVLKNKIFFNTIKYYDICFTSCIETCKIYNEFSRHVYLLPPVDSKIHYYDYDPLYDCDIAVIITNLYKEEEYYKNQIINRYKLICELVKHFKVNIYGPKYLENEFCNQYKEYIPYGLNRKVFSSAKLVLNTHVENAYGYFNERTIDIMACSGLMLIDRVKGIELLDNCCIVLEYSIDKIINQIKYILEHIKDYEYIRNNAYQKSKEFHVQKWCDVIINHVSTIL